MGPNFDVGGLIVKQSCKQLRETNDISSEELQLAKKYTKKFFFSNQNKNEINFFKDILENMCLKRDRFFVCFETDCLRAHLKNVNSRDDEVHPIASSFHFLIENFRVYLQMKL